MLQCIVNLDVVLMIGHLMWCSSIIDFCINKMRGTFRVITLEEHLRER